MFELTYNYGKDKYDNFKGEGYGQVALSSEVRLIPFPSHPLLFGPCNLGCLSGCGNMPAAALVIECYTSLHVAVMTRRCVAPWPFHHLYHVAETHPLCVHV